MDDSLQLLIIDDHVMLREGLVSLFQAQSNFEVIGQAGSVERAVQLYNELDPDILLLDYYLPDGTGLDVIKAVMHEDPDAVIVLLTHTEDDEMIYEAIRGGAKGCLLKSQPSMELVNSLQRVVGGEAALSRKMTRSLIERIATESSSKYTDQLHPFLKRLTQREMEVLIEIVNDASNKEIAARLGVSIYTVKNHISNILSKLELRNRREAATFARKYNIHSSS